MKETEMQLVPYSLEAAVIEELKSKYMDITIPEGDKAAYAMVMGGLKECREIRLAVDAWHKDKKAWIVKAGKHYDKEKNRVHALVEPIENHLKAERAKEDDRIELIKAEQVRIEQARVDRIRTKIAIMSIPSILNVSFKTSAEVKSMLDKITDIPITPEDYQEFATEAAAVKAEAVTKLAEMYEERKRLEDEAERIEKVRKEQEAEAARLAAEKKAQEEAAAKVRAEQEAEAKRLEDIRKAEDEKIRKEREAIETEKRRIQEEKDRAEFERQAKERAEADARAKVEAESRAKADAEAREKAEAARKAALAPDREKVVAYGNALLAVIGPTVENENTRKLLKDFYENLGAIVGTLKLRAEAL